MTEDQLEQETLQWLAQVGYTVKHGLDIAPDGSTPLRSNYQQVLLQDNLRKALQRLNPHMPQAAHDEALAQVLDLGVPALLPSNRAFHKLLVNGVPVSYQVEGETRGDLAKLVDWGKVANNQFWAVNQFSVKGQHHTRRPDIVLFVNGLPLVVMELKNPADLHADIWMAYDQIETYKAQIPELFRTNALLVISDGAEARMGSLSADRERYMQWRTIDGVNIDPLGEFGELETLIRGVLAPEILLDYLRYCVLFEDDGRLVKKVAGYHQYHAVRAAIARVLEAANKDAAATVRGKGGVVWHTQGSGKSITMTCFAARVLQEPQLQNPTIVVITDRNDLDGQLFGVFSLAQDLLREQPVQAHTRQALRQVLANRPSGGIIFATIQKFMPGEDEDTFPVLSERSNIVVLADEAHRTQYGFAAKLKIRKAKYPVATPSVPLTTDGQPVAQQAQFAPPEHEVLTYQAGYAQHLRDALPQATFVAFTGTPVSSSDKNTEAVFGSHIHIYDMQQAKEDGATVPIYYESRLAKLKLNDEVLPLLDDEVDELAEDEEEDQQAKSKSKWAALEKVVGTQTRIDSVALDIVTHFEARNAANRGKAMVVAMSRDICVHLYDAIVQLRPDWHSEDPEHGAIKIVMTGSASDKALLRPHIYGSAIKKRLEKRFKDPADPLQLVIVRDMWLTGFDAPCVHTMYVDKPMKGHNLMQAIARVNRVFKNKPGGLVVDYIGIANELKAALKTYTEAKGKGDPTHNATEALAVLLEKLDVVRGLMHGCDYSAFETQATALLLPCANHLLGLKDGKARFLDTMTALGKAYALCGTLDEAAALRKEIAFFSAVKAAIAKFTTVDKKRATADQHSALKQILDNAIVADGVADIFALAGLDKPNIGLLSDEFLEDVRQMKTRNLAVELLEKLLRDEIKARARNNVVQEKKYGDRLLETLRKYHNRAIETAQVMEELIQMAKEFQAVLEREAALGLGRDEIAFYDALAHNESAVRELGDETLKKIAVEITEKLRASTTVDWQVRESVRARLRILVRRCLQKWKYPPDQQPDAVELVLQQAQALSEAWTR